MPKLNANKRSLGVILLMVTGISISSFLLTTQIASAGALVQLRSSYDGTFNNLSVHLHGPLSLRNVSESDTGMISGEWSAGSPNECASGPFSGRVKHHSISFTVTSGNGCTALVFTGKLHRMGSTI